LDAPDLNFPFVFYLISEHKTFAKKISAFEPVERGYQKNLVHLQSKFFPPNFSSVFWKREIWREKIYSSITLQRSFCLSKTLFLWTYNLLNSCSCLTLGALNKNYPVFPHQ
jgi:hypothetical protein